MSDTDSMKKDEPKEGRYKILCWAPGWLQWINNAKGFLVGISLYIMTATFITGGIVNINVSTIEKRFGLQSSDSAIVLVGYDIAFCILTIFVTYFGGRASRPKLVAAGCGVFGLGALVYALPHFTSPNYLFGEDELQVVCPTNASAVSDGCTGLKGDLSNYMFVLLIGELLMGAGATPMFTLGLTYIEDSVSKHAAPIYLSIANSAAVIGPMIGFLVGGEFLFGYYVDFEKGVEHGLTVFDPRWVGAWWIAPLIATAICCVLVIPLVGFPKQLPGTNENRAKRVSEVHKHGGSKAARKTDFGKSYKDIPKAVFIILRNPTFLFIILGGCCQAVLINGVSAFMAKFVEVEFHLSAGRAAQISGAVLVPSGALGHIIAGIIINRTKWKTPAMLKFMAASVFVVVAIVPVGFVYCGNSSIAGVTAPYAGGTLDTRNLTNACNVHCECQEEYYIPVCGSNNVTYFSPCHAGCYDAEYADNATSPTAYTICTCAPPFAPPTDLPTGRTTPGSCTVPCNTLAAFLAGMFFAIMISFFPLTPSLIIQLRIVPESMRSFALGVQWLFVRLIGTIPGPIIYGAFIDMTCILWQRRRCDGAKGSCWVYDNHDLAVAFIVISMVGNFLAGVFFSLACFFYKPEREEASRKSLEAVESKFAEDEENLSEEKTPKSNGYSFKKAEANNEMYEVIDRL